MESARNAKGDCKKNLEKELADAKQNCSEANLKSEWKVIQHLNRFMMAICL